MSALPPLDMTCGTLSTAILIDMDVESKIIFEIPDDGRKISREAFEKIRAEKLGSMKSTGDDAKY